MHCRNLPGKKSTVRPNKQADVRPRVSCITFSRTPFAHLKVFSPLLARHYTNIFNIFYSIYIYIYVYIIGFSGNGLCNIAMFHRIINVLRYSEQFSRLVLRNLGQRNSKIFFSGFDKSNWSPFTWGSVRPIVLSLYWTGEVKLYVPITIKIFVSPFKFCYWKFAFIHIFA